MIDTRITSEGFIPARVTKEQAKDTGMAMVLICLLLGMTETWNHAYLAATALLLVNMTWATAFKPVAKVWLGLSHLMGTVMSKILLSLVFLLVVTPVAILRRALGKDSLALRRWKKADGSAFAVRDHTYTPRDIEMPF